MAGSQNIMVQVQDGQGPCRRLNLLPQGRVNANAQKLLQLYPLPNTAGFLNDFFYNPELTNTENQGGVRFDPNFSANDTVFS